MYKPKKKIALKYHDDSRVNMFTMNNVKIKELESEVFTFAEYDPTCEAYYDMVLEVNYVICKDQCQHGFVASSLPPELGSIKHHRVNIYRESKFDQSRILDELIEKENLNLKLTNATVIKNDGYLEASTENPKVIRPQFGSNSRGVKLIEYSCNVREVIERLDDRIGIHHPQAGSLLYAGRDVVVTDYVSNVKEEYRLHPTRDNPFQGYKRCLHLNESAMMVPHVPEDHSFKVDTVELPPEIKVAVETICEKLNIWGYSLDLYVTSEGEWGVFEYSGEFGLAGIEKQWILQNRTDMLTEWVRQALSFEPSTLDHSKDGEEYIKLTRPTNLAGSHLKAYRVSEGLTTAEAAKAINVSLGYYSRLETGAAPLQAKVLKQASDKLEVRPEHFETIPAKLELFSEIIRGLTLSERVMVESVIKDLMIPTTILPEAIIEKARAKRRYLHPDKTMRNLLKL